MATALIRRYTGLLGLDELILQNIEVARPLTLETPFTSGHLIFSMFHDDCVVVGCEKYAQSELPFLPLSLFCPLQIGEVRWKIQRATHCVSFRKKGEPISSCVLLHRSAILWNALKLVPEYTYINWALLKRET